MYLEWQAVKACCTDHRREFTIQCKPVFETGVYFLQLPSRCEARLFIDSPTMLSSSLMNWPRNMIENDDMENS